MSMEVGSLHTCRLALVITDAHLFWQRNLRARPWSGERCCRHAQRVGSRSPSLYGPRTHRVRASMETATALPTHQSTREPVPSATGGKPSGTLPVRAMYLLSEDGR